MMMRTMMKRAVMLMGMGMMAAVKMMLGRESKLIMRMRMSIKVIEKRMKRHVLLLW